jgi:hypothetical protein
MKMERRDRLEVWVTLNKQFIEKVQSIQQVMLRLEHLATQAEIYFMATKENKTFYALKWVRTAFKKKLSSFCFLINLDMMNYFC